MKKWIWLLLAWSLARSIVFAWPRLGAAAAPATLNTGDTGQGISVAISSTQATKVYTGQPYHREVLLQNTNTTYTVYCATYSAVTAVSGQFRWALWASPAGNYTSNGTFNVYCIGAAGAPSIEIIGSVEMDAKDIIP